MSQSSQPVDNFVFLNGRPPMQEFIGSIKIMAANGHDIESNALDVWRSAHDRVREPEQAESGFAGHTVVGPIDPAAAIVTGGSKQSVSPDNIWCSPRGVGHC
jgi:hypothetical protein